MKKRIVSLLMVFSLIVGLLPTVAMGAKSSTDVAYAVTGGNIYFDKSTGTVTYCDKNVTVADIPETIDGVKVTGIGVYTFYGCSDLTSVSIPSGVTSIEDDAFHLCYNLTAITVDQSNTEYCDKDGVLFNKDQTVLVAYPNAKATSYTIPSSVKSIGSYAFCDCSDLTSVSIPNSVTSIGDWAFSECSGLTSISIPNGVTSIGDDAFLGCSNLTSVSIPNSVMSIGDSAFYNCSGLTSVSIPSSVTSIGDWAFSECSSLTSVNIPGSVTSIRKGAFCGCSSLTDVYYSGTEAQWKAINIDNVYNYNDDLLSATIHYNSGGASDELKVTSVVLMNNEKSDPGFLLQGDARALVMQVASPIQLGTGNIYVKDSSTDQVIASAQVCSGYNIQITPKDNVYEVDVYLKDLFGASFPSGKTFYIAFNDGVFVDPVTKQPYRGFSTKSTCTISTYPVEIWGFTNTDMVTSIIPVSTYEKFFPHLIAKIFQSFDDGSNGQCFGMAITAGTATCGFPYYKTFASNRTINSLYEISDKNTYNEKLSMTAAEYISLSQVAQKTLDFNKRLKESKNNFSGLRDAVLAYQNGSGGPVVIGLDGSHALLASYIVETDDRCDIYAYDCNFPTDNVVLHLYKQNGEYKTWKVINYTKGRTYGYNEKVCYLVVDNSVIEKLNTVDESHTALINDNGRYDLLSCGIRPDFSITGNNNQTAVVLKGEILSEDLELCFPIMNINDGKDNPQSNSLFWVLNDTPITFKADGDENALTDISLTGSNESINVKVDASATVTLATSNCKNRDDFLAKVEASSSVSAEMSVLYLSEGSEYLVSTSGDISDVATTDLRSSAVIFDGLSNHSITVQHEDDVKTIGVPEQFQDSPVYVSISESEKEGTCVVTLSSDLDSDGTPDKTIHQSLLSDSSSSEPTQPETPFLDLLPTDYFYAPVRWAVENGITTGVSATAFAPMDVCSRAQIVTFLWRAAGEPEVTFGNGFADVAADAYYAKAVAWAVEKGITTGTSDTTFSPDAPCTRAQAVTFLWRCAGEPEAETGSAFSDVIDKDYYAKAVAWAAEQGITTGTTDTTFSPSDPCTRAQIVSFLYRDRVETA